MKKTLLCLLTVLILGCAAGAPLYAAEITGQPWAPGEILVKFKKGVADQAQAARLLDFSQPFDLVFDKCARPLPAGARIHRREHKYP